MITRLLVLAIFLATALVSDAASSQSLATAKGSIRYSLGADWKILAIPSRSPEATVRFAKHNPASAGSDFDAIISISALQMQWPETDNKYKRFVSSISGAKSMTGSWIVYRNGLRYLDQNYFNRTAFRDIADVHMIVTIQWFRLPSNDAKYDQQMEATFRALLGSIGNGAAKPK